MFSSSLGSMRHHLALAAFRAEAPRSPHDELVIRRATSADAAGLRRLAALDESPAPSGPVLVAEVAGRLLAALPLGGGEPVADPFSPSADLVSLLAVRAAQLRGDDSDGGQDGRPVRRTSRVLPPAPARP